MIEFEKNHLAVMNDSQEKRGKKDTYFNFKKDGMIKEIMHFQKEEKVMLK